MKCIYIDSYSNEKVIFSKLCSQKERTFNFLTRKVAYKIKCEWNNHLIG